MMINIPAFSQNARDYIDQSYRTLDDMPDSAYIYANMAITKASEESNTDLLLEALYTKGYLEKYHNGSIAASIVVYMEAIRVGEGVTSEKGRDQLLSVYKNIGNIYNKYLLDYTEASNYYIKALDLAQQLNNGYDISHLSYLIGSIYLSMNDYERAEEFTIKAFEKNKEVGNKELELKILSSWSYIDEKKGDIQSALERNQRSYAIAKGYEKVDYQILALQNIANLQYKKGDLDSALLRYKEVIKLAQIHNNKRIQKIASLDLAELHLDTEKPEMAYQVLERGKLLSTADVRTLKTLRRINAQLGNYQDALSFSIHADSLTKLKIKDQQLLNVEVQRAQVNQKIAEYHYILEREKEINNLVNQIKWSVVGIFLLVTLAVAYDLWRKTKRKKDLEAHIKAFRSDMDDLSLNI